jgi:ATP-dependent exoDNAse (exonuclease V) beta subunit
MSSLVDGEARRLFACELDRNFSVVASAGSGKTRAITDRVVEMARSPQALKRLPELVVVTYTNRAANEMQQRARQQILEDPTLSRRPELIEAFNRAFFGTIHSFCMKLLATHGHHLGLPQNLELITDDGDLWNEFVQQYTTIGRSLPEEKRRLLLRHVQARQLMELAHNTEMDLAAVELQMPYPEADFARVYAAKEHASLNIPKAKTELQQWEERWRKTDGFVPWPSCVTTSKEFVRIWRDEFRALREWVNTCALCVAAEVQRDYREFRIQRGLLKYVDQIFLAGELIRFPEVVRRIREQNYRVILDEAQDTDPQQFFVLLEIAREIEATSSWIENPTSSSGPRPGHFCMVGDFQQSIYRDPADLSHYRELHDLLVASRAAEELKFSVTFRLDAAQLNFVNATFGEILNDQNGQVPFIELNPRPDVLPGQVIRFDFGCDVDLSSPESQRALLEARELAAWLRNLGLRNLRAESWRQVAVLCPRKAWLRTLRDALANVDLPVEVHSESDRRGENPAYAWLTGLLTVMADPDASYQIVGVLREIFGLSDDDLHRFCEGDPARFQIRQRSSGNGVVAKTLNNLSRIRAAILQQPLFSRVQEVVRCTQLRERLRSLPEQEFGDVTDELDELLSTAAAAEAGGVSLADFVHSLRAQFHAMRETHPSPRDAIQLITAHKAKGSEWQAVIVPFLTREVHDGRSPYPYAIRNVNAPGAKIIFDAADFDECKEELKEIDRQEMERLLYVALTRAKHTLILAFDRQFFLNNRGQFHRNSQISLLRAGSGGCNCEAVAALSNTARECNDTRASQSSASLEHVPEQLEARQLGWIDDARRNAFRFVHAINPSKFAQEQEVGSSAISADSIEIEAQWRRGRIETPAMRYGIWWHDFIQKVAWKSQPEAWQATFEADLVDSPDPARSRREWKLLTKYASDHPDFLAGHIHVEMPLFWRIDDERCLEGLIDVAICEPDKNKWFVLDWKTNRVDQDELEDLRVAYRPQLAAYWKAVAEITKRPVSAGIYSTATGELIVYTEKELGDEWEQLKQLPLQDLEPVVADYR